jgi:uncharacterized protein (UPF0335 family)
MKNKQLKVYTLKIETLKPVTDAKISEVMSRLKGLGFTVPICNILRVRK